MQTESIIIDKTMPVEKRARVLVSMTLPYPMNRWANIIAALLLFGVNLVGVPGYPGVYDKFLIVVSLGFNVLTLWYAWSWV